MGRHNGTRFLLSGCPSPTCSLTGSSHLTPYPTISQHRTNERLQTRLERKHRGYFVANLCVRPFCKVSLGLSDCRHVSRHRQLRTASNSNRSSPACSPVLRKRCRSPTLQNLETDNMVEKGSEQSDTSKSPSTPEQLVTRTLSGQSTRSWGKNSKHERQHILRETSQPEVSLVNLLILDQDSGCGEDTNTNMDSSLSSQEDWETLMELEEALAGWLIQGSDWNQDCLWGSNANPYQDEEIPAVLSPTYKQRNEDFRKLFKQLPDTERLIVDYSCALQRDILLQGRLYLSENWICFYSNIFRWETLCGLKDICSMTKEKTARLIPNAIQVCTDTEKHFFTSFGARDRTYMMMFRLWQNALLDKPLCPKELWHFVHQCYGNELGLTSDDEDYVPPDDDFNTMGYCEEIPAEENEVIIDNSSKSSVENKLDNSSPLSHKRSITHSTITSTTPPSSTDSPLSFDIGAEEYTDCLPDSDLLPLRLLVDERNSEPESPLAPAPSPSLDFNDNEDIPTDLSDSSVTDEDEVQAFHEDLNGRQYINEVYKFSVDKLYDILFTESQFMTDFMEQRRFTDVVHHPWKKEEAGDQTREIMYTISLSNPLAPKTATVTETQTLYKASQESECYIIDAEVITHDVPYHDYFYTMNRYMLTRVAKNKCRLRVSTELKYKKQPWGLVKSFIEKNFWSGLNQNFKSLEVELAKMEDAQIESQRPSPRAKALKNSILRRRNRPLTHLRTAHLDETLSPVTTPTDEDVVQRIKHVAGSTQTKHIPEHTSGGGVFCNLSKPLLIISFVLLLLVFLNIMLFYKLWMLEYSAQSLTSWQGLRLHDSSKLPQTQVEWAQLLESQQRYHDAELHKWKEIIKSSVLLLDQMKDSLLSLQKGVGLRDYSSDTEEKRSRPRFKEETKRERLCGEQQESELTAPHPTPPSTQAANLVYRFAHSAP
ncbi:GRAM domain-containing protein 1B [Triplophysa tibetana]|uniref:GRAM domain-containing protein 1B n=1 Tax=Triplophysa tibetana TaxID=1572043 RepID=A0A5A9NZK4_9TELE|nr:GRAM domain-containing protein 1B [Triplophysa tibetana]